MNSGSSAKYPTLSLDELCKLEIPADKDCILFLWATVPMLPDALQLLSHWGFKYKTSIFWRKIMLLGLGFWFRGQIEICLLGIKGKVKAFRCQHPNFIQCKVGKHSEKPQELLDLIEPYCLKPKLEMFATKKREGWNALGFDIDGKDIRNLL